MLKLSQKDLLFIKSTYEQFPVSYGKDHALSWRIVGDELDSDSDYVCVIGAFDGFHRGHLALLAEAKAIADDKNMKLVVCMFDPDPTIYFKPEVPNEELLTADERIALLMEAGADSCLCFTFNHHLALLDYKEFLNRLCLMFSMKHICVGLDFKLGARGEGTFDKLVAYGIKAGFEVSGVDLMMEKDFDNTKISSTTIREAIVDGDIQAANDLLGHFSLIDGVVEHGRGEGTSFGYPTANIMCLKRRVAPSNGVYAAYVSNGKRVWPSALHVGLPPTFDEGNIELSNWLLESFLLDCHENLYGQKLRVFLTDKIGETQKFESIDALERALQGYIEATEILLGDSAISL